MWDLTTGLAVTTTLAAAARAVATGRGLINDPFAAPLVRAVGVEFLTRVAGGGRDLDEFGADGGFARLAEFFAARSRFFDNFVAEATAAGVRQVVLLGAGLDARAYRLWWPDATTLYEVDQSPVMDFKTATLRDLGAVPTVDRRAVGVDPWHCWPTALRRAGFDADEPAVWVAEGLLIGFLAPDVQDRLLDNVTGLSAAGSRFAADHTVLGSRSQVADAQSLAELLRRRGLRIDFAGLPHPGERNDVARYLAERGWAVAGCGIADLFAAVGLAQLSAAELHSAPAAIGYLTAVCGNRSRRVSSSMVSRP